MKFNWSIFLLWFYVSVMSQNSFLYIWIPNRSSINHWKDYPSLSCLGTTVKNQREFFSSVPLIYVSVITPVYIVSITLSLKKVLKSDSGLIQNCFDYSKSFVCHTNFNTNRLLQFWLCWIYRLVLGEFTILHYWVFISINMIHISSL